MQFSYPALPSPEWILGEGARIERLAIHCWAEWNGYDLELHRNLLLTQKKLLPIETQVRSLDIENQMFWPFLKTHNVVNVPTLILFSNGRHVATKVGAARPEVIAQWLSGMTQI